MLPQSIASGDLRVVFDRRGDRFGHRVERRIDGDWQAVLESIEGAPHDEWPPSPVLQSLQIEERTDSTVALLVGMAGKSHWSASIEAAGDAGLLVFDFACRVRQLPDRMTTSYRPLSEQADRRIAIEADAQPPVRITQTANEWIIAPHEPSPGPATVRWRYSIRTVDATVAVRRNS